MNPTKTTPKDFFLHLGIIICLYTSTLSLLSLVFYTINYLFPDRLSYTMYVDPYGGAVRLAVASLLIIFPLMLVLSWLVNKDMKIEPLKAELGVRKWLTYITLFFAGIAIITDLVILINTFLGGEITTRFIFKVLAVFIVTALVFWYYLYDLKRNGGNYRKITAIVAVAIVLLSIIGGFVVVGSPMKARAVRFDLERVGNLAEIQRQVTSYYQQKQKLPATLGELNDSLSGFLVPTDPETGQNYTYAVTAPLAFRLCATFSEPTVKNIGGYGSYMDYDSRAYFEHTAGQVCFDRSIDPELYPPIKDTIRTVPKPAM